MSIGKTSFLVHLQRRLRSGSFLAPVLGAALLVACGTGSSVGGGQSGITGTEVIKPGSSDKFLVDPNESGQTRRLRIVEVSWGRLVDVHAIDASGDTVAKPEFRDFVVSQEVLTDGVDYRLEANPVTHQARLVILRQRSDPGFRTLLDGAASGVKVIVPKNDDGTSPGPFPFVPRNACVVLRFNDVLDDSAAATATLNDDVKVLTGYSPSIPFSARILFDPNHGALVGGAFHSTRVLIDTTVSAAEASQMATPLPVNAIGLPASSPTTAAPNVSIRIPTRVRTNAGQFSILESLSGFPLDVGGNGPVANDPTLSVVRAMRSGNANDSSNGFLRDLTRPEVLGSWPFTSLSVINDGGGELGFDFILDVQFTTACQQALAEGDILSVGPHFLEVQQATGPPDGGGAIFGVRARNISDTAITVLSTLTGGATLLTPYDAASPAPSGCWVTFTPEPVTAPTTGVSTTAVASVRFTEPMDPAFLTALDTFTLVRGGVNQAATGESIVVGIVQGGPDLDAFSFTQSLPLSHVTGTAENYHVAFRKAPKDLAGNKLAALPPKVGFTIDPNEPTAENGGFTFTFDSSDTMGWDDGADEFTGTPDGRIDVRGQVFFDPARGVLKPRSVLYASYAADRTQVIPGLMAAVPTGVQDPLLPLGSKLQAIWRYCDFGWRADDETKHNLDVIGLAWAPIGGNVIQDYFDNFEIALGHSTRLPDEDLNANGFPREPSGGLLGSPNPFGDNVLDDPIAPLKVVHPRSLGYEISAVNLFRSSTGTVMMPFPYNRSGAPRTRYLWRDTGSAGVADPSLESSGGLPLNIEVANGLGVGGSIVPNGRPLPTMALPLLMEFRCFPSSSGVGLNALDVSMATSSATTPNFRAWSSGGTDTSGNAIKKNPDQEMVPSGGFNPLSIPPGQPTLNDADNVFYLGQIDTVVRVSRAILAWVDTKTSNSLGASYFSAVVEPDPSLFPVGTQLIAEFRGAETFTALAAQPSYIPFDAASVNWYGYLRGPALGGPGGLTTFKDGDESWHRDITEVNGARYLQTRLTFVNNVDSGLTVELSAIGIPFIENK